MSADLLWPPPHLSPANALRLSQEAPRILQKSTVPALPYPLSLLVTSESQESWMLHENLFLACLRTGDDKSAWICLDRLTKRFGNENEKILAMRGMYEEAVARDTKGLEVVLRGYEKTLKANPENMPIRKRRVALLRSLQRIPEATGALVELVDISPTDAESWAELSELYFSQGLYQQAIFALEEVLLITPNAWNIQAALGELTYVAATSNSEGNDGYRIRGLAESMQRFCRSIELCDDYLRGYYGLKLTSKRLAGLLETNSKSLSSSTSDTLFADVEVPPLATVQRLHELATKRLGELVRRGAESSPGAKGYEEPELIAARELLDRDRSNVPR